MNELIENQLIEQLESIMLSTSINDAMEFFKQAVQAACQAQRNACIREFKRYSKAHEYKISNNWAKAISMSKIERQDYE